MHLRTDKTMWKHPVRQALAAFGATVATVRRYRIAGRQLDLLGAGNAVVASFEAVALR